MKRCLPGRPRWSIAGKAMARRACQGAVLLEVVLALILFVGAAAILSGGMNASIRTLDRVRLNMHASNLASSVLAEVSMGLREARTTGETPFEAPFEEWTWELESSPWNGGGLEMGGPVGNGLASLSEEGGGLPLVRLEVTIRHGFESIVYRLVQAVPAVSPTSAAANESEDDFIPSGLATEGLP